MSSASLICIVKVLSRRFSTRRMVSVTVVSYAVLGELAPQFAIAVDTHAVNVGDQVPLLAPVPSSGEPDTIESMRKPL